MADISIQVNGLDKVIKALDKFPQEVTKYLAQAGDETAKRQILNTQGLKKYPPLSEANQPPTPYYIRGRGTQTAHGNRGGSERAGTQWYVKHEGLDTIIGNRASYNIYVYGDMQPAHMAQKGWRKLTEVAQEKLDKITKVYQAWVDKLIRDLGL